ncbi:MAG TPA: hypothetical protein VFY01_00845 [Rheinheimera sp.]|nr:hypothetical protein [Rheinheimera sp.]
MKILLTAAVCLVTGFVFGVMFTQAPVAHSDNAIAASRNVTPSAPVAVKNAMPAQLIAPQQQDDLTRDELISALQDHIWQLEQQLTRQTAVVEPALTQPEYAPSSATHAKTSVAMHTVSVAEAEAELPQPFAGFIAGFKGTLAERFQKLQQEQIDYDWAPVMEQQIADFISMHPLSADVQLQSVRCKSSLCEIRGFESGEHSWSQISSNMRAEDWWQFYSVHSSAKTSEQFGRFFYMTAERGVATD